MYSEDKKKERIYAQIDALFGLGFGFGRLKKSLIDILQLDEDIYGYLIGYNDDSGKSEVILCTNYRIYLLDRQGFFTTNYTQHPVKSVTSVSVEKKLFNMHSVSLVVGRERIDFSNCNAMDVQNFRRAINSAQSRGNFPYQFDKTPYLDGYVEEKKVYVPRPEVEEEEPQESAKEIAERERKERKRIATLEKGAITLDGSNPDFPRNVYLYPKVSGEGFTKIKIDTYVLDPEYDNHAVDFERLTGVEPNFFDYGYLISNNHFTSEMVLKNRVSEVIEQGRKGLLYKLKESLGESTKPSDYLSIEDNVSDGFIKEPVSERESMAISANHIASRFKNAPKEEEPPTEIEEPLEEVEDFEFNIDFDDLDMFKNKKKSEPEVEAFIPIEKEIEISSVDSFETKAVREIMEYKHLLDIGVISESEFQHKKKEILGL